MTRTESNLFTLSKKMLLILEDQFDSSLHHWTPEDTVYYLMALESHKETGGIHHARTDIIEYFETQESLPYG